MRSSDGLAQCRLGRSDGRLSCKRLRQPVVRRGLRLIGGGKSLIGGVGGDFDDHDVALALQDGAEVSTTNTHARCKKVRFGAGHYPTLFRG